MKAIAYSVLPLFFLLVSCNSKTVYEETKKIDERWTYKDTLNFEASITDTSKVYNLYLIAAHSKDYYYQNLYMKIHTKFPDGKRIQQELGMDFAANDGEWLGDCGFSSCENEALLQENFYFNQIGNYVFTIEQFMRQDSLQGLSSIGIKIEESELKRENLKTKVKK